MRRYLAGEGIHGHHGLRRDAHSSLGDGLDDGLGKLAVDESAGVDSNTFAGGASMNVASADPCNLGHHDDGLNGREYGCALCMVFRLDTWSLDHVDACCDMAVANGGLGTGVEAGAKLRMGQGSQFKAFILPRAESRTFL